MPFFRRSMGARRRLPRERFEWFGAQQSTPATVAVNTLDTRIVANQATLEEFPMGSIVRIYGNVYISPATGPAGATGYAVFAGITPREIGTTSIAYDPEIAPEHRWFWNQSCYPVLGGTGAADQNSARWAGYFRFDIDIRPRFRFREDVEIVIAVKNSNNSGATIQYSYMFRTLVAAGRR